VPRGTVAVCASAHVAVVVCIVSQFLRYWQKKNIFWRVVGEFFLTASHHYKSLIEFSRMSEQPHQIALCLYGAMVFRLFCDTKICCG